VDRFTATETRAPLSNDWHQDQRDPDVTQRRRF
jgi:hypothetical protein